MNEQLVSFELRDGVAVVGMDDGKANALSYAMLEALHGALDRADREASAVVLAGRPGRFCAGFDLKTMMAGPESAQALLTKGAELLLRLYAHPQPIVAASTGHALAGGALVLLTCDLRLGARGDFRIGLNEVAIGLPVPILAHELARDRLAKSALTDAVLFARVYNPDEATAAGYLDRVVDAERVLDEAVSEARRLGQLPRPSFSQSKRSLRRETIKYIRETLAMNIAEFMPPG
ncbi:MAG: crotonase/enoyl-CoA hydratase family protein [Minicystis sp.]